MVSLFRIITIFIVCSAIYIFTVSTIFLFKINPHSSEIYTITHKNVIRNEMQMMQELRNENKASTLDEIMNHSNVGNEYGTITLLLIQSDPAILRNQLNALSLQTIHPNEIIVFSIIDELTTEIDLVIDRFHSRFKPHTLKTLQLSNSIFLERGRFHHVLSVYISHIPPEFILIYYLLSPKYIYVYVCMKQNQAKYTWIIDGDIIPGRKYLQQLLVTIQSKEYSGVLGSLGYVMPPPDTRGVFPPFRHKYKKDSENFLSYHGKNIMQDSFFVPGSQVPDYRYGWGSDVITSVDWLCNSWFMKTEWMAYLFQEVQTYTQCTNTYIY